MSAKAGLVHTEDSRPRPEGYGAALKDHFTGAQKRRPAQAMRDYRDNFDLAFPPDSPDGMNAERFCAGGHLFDEAVARS